MKKLLAVVSLLSLSACYYGPSYATNPVQQCPSPFWAGPEVEMEFMKYPDGSPMRNFYTHYLIQQQAIESHYSPVTGPTRGHSFSPNTARFNK